MALDVENILQNANVSYRLIPLLKPGVTSEDVLKNASESVNSEEICKTIVVKASGKCVAFFIRGTDKIDIQKAKQVLSGKPSMLSHQELYDVTGKEPGSVCPFLLNVPVYVDQTVLRTHKINFGSGHPNFGLEITSKDLEHVLLIAGFIKGKQLGANKYYEIVNVSKSGG